MCSCEEEGAAAVILLLLYLLKEALITRRRLLLQESAGTSCCGIEDENYQDQLFLPGVFLGEVIAWEEEPQKLSCKGESRQHSQHSNIIITLSRYWRG